MVANRKVTGTASSIPAGLALGAAVSLAITLAGAWIFAYLIAGEILKESSIGYCAMAIILLASVVSAAVAVGRIKRRRVYICGLSGLIYFGILLSVTALFFGGQYQAVGITALLILAGSGAVALLGLRGEGTASHRKKKRPAR